MSSENQKMAMGTAQRDYRSLPTRELVELIVNKADRHALHESHARRLFRLASGKCVVFAEYIDNLREHALSGRIGRDRGTILIEAVFDLLTDRFV
jgi:hypothetical protein